MRSRHVIDLSTNTLPQTQAVNVPLHDHRNELHTLELLQLAHSPLPGSLSLSCSTVCTTAWPDRTRRWPCLDTVDLITRHGAGVDVLSVLAPSTSGSEGATNTILWHERSLPNRTTWSCECYWGIGTVTGTAMIAVDAESSTTVRTRPPPNRRKDMSSTPSNTTHTHNHKWERSLQVVSKSQ